ncbi:catalase [Chitinimonas sp.]|uniref:catalase n=1 Tax=Chitinimonas sp. TaxID=1934313 RepID=UPI0035AF8566
MKLPNASLTGLLAINLFCASYSQAAEKVAPVTPQALLDQLRALPGTDANGRVQHNKGVILTGTFEPTIQAALMSRARHFHFPSQVIARFSNATGLPDIADNSPNASPHGVALRFTMPDDGRYTDIVMHGYNGFPVRTGEEFAEFLRVLAAPGSGKSSPLERFLGKHPAAKRFINAPRPIWDSYASETFYGVNTFVLRNDKDKPSPGRYILVPDAKGNQLTESETASFSPNYLADELRERIRRTAITFDLVFQLPEKGDKLDDASISWPDTRKRLVLGTVYLTAAMPDSATQEKQLALNPLNLADGVDISNDPLLRVRGSTYALGASARGVAGK